MSGISRGVVQFSGPGRPVNQRRLLLISYHFPPSQATGALRWQKLSGIAEARGWALDVITVAPLEQYPPDPGPLAELPVDTRVYGIPAQTPLLEQTLDWLSAVRRRASSAVVGTIPVQDTSSAEVDAAIVYPWQIRARDWLSPGAIRRSLNAWRAVTFDDAWGRVAAGVASRIAERGVHRCVISCGPPHAAHEAAFTVSRQTGIPLVIDLRDPWGLAQAVSRSRASHLFFALRRRREKRVVRSARLVFVNSESHQIALKAVHPEAANRIVCVLNGYDPELHCASGTAARFTLAYAGNIYLDRDPRPLFQAAAAVVQKLGLTPDQFGIEMMGSVERFGNRRTEDLARALGIGDFVHLHGRRPRHEALSFLRRATMLLSLPQDLDLSVPSKLFDYFQYEAWVLALAERSSGTELLLRGTGADVVSPRDVPRIADAIERRYCEFASGIRPRRLAQDNPDLARSAQGEKLFDVLAATLAGSGGNAIGPG